MDLQDPIETETLPKEIPLFPLNGVLLLPSGQLPLNIFEPRYLAMVEDALKGPRLIGMIQPRDNLTASGNQDTQLFNIGCAGRITAFEETEDGRYLVTLTGLSRFRIAEELEIRKSGYRYARVDWEEFGGDINLEECLGLDRARLKDLLGQYFRMHNLSCDWDAVDGAADQKLITCLSMICPLGPNEKQALLEAACCHSRAEMFMTMLDMAVREDDACRKWH